MKSSNVPSEAWEGEPEGARLVLGGEAEPVELNGELLHTYDTRHSEAIHVGALERYRQAARELEVSDRLELQTTGATCSASGHEVILDESNLLPFDFLRTGDRLGRAVVKLERGDGASGTGFLVAPGVLLTNHHVLPDAEVAAKTRAFANYEVNPPTDAGGRTAVVGLQPGQLFVTNAELDFSFCGVRELDFLGSVRLDRDSLSVLPSEFVNIIQHPRGRPKEVALQDNRVVKVDNVVVQYCCDTEPGSSGSPVFNNQWHLVVLHHASVVVEHGSGRPAEDGLGSTRFLNEGIRLSAIAVWLETVEADAILGRVLAARLRGIFHGVDPQIGFFGALGRQIQGRSAAEAVMECYHEGSAALDLAYWELGSLEENFAERLGVVGWALGGLGIDLWCLGGLDRGRVAALREHVESHFRLDFQFLTGPTADEGERPLVIVARRSLALEVDWSDGKRRPPRIRGRVPLCRRRWGVVQVVPLIRDGRGVPRRGRIEAIVTAAADEPTAELVLLGDGLTTKTLHALGEARPNLRAALGPEGGVAVLPSEGSRLRKIFVGPNLDLTIGAADRLSVVHDRSWPSTVAELGVPRPIALRLAFEVSLGRRKRVPSGRRILRPATVEDPGEEKRQVRASEGE